ncbi:heterocycloanthracin/sonorensin family bacteriocin, partial [Bacillus thuringiensis]|nr:heterocycloanthracin/sonorensin family bacteriocin [Bacillus thuringiensis]
MLSIFIRYNSTGSISKTIKTVRATTTAATTATASATKTTEATNTTEVMKMNQFQQELQALSLNDYRSGNIVYWDQ